MQNGIVFTLILTSGVLQFMKLTDDGEDLVKKGVTAFGAIIAPFALRANS